MECEWLITSPWDKSIEITINDMQMEDIGKCDYDYLAVSSVDFIVVFLRVYLNFKDLQDFLTQTALEFEKSCNEQVKFV